MPGALADRGERDARRRAEGFLRAADRDVDPPPVELERHGAQRGHDVDHDHGTRVVRLPHNRFRVDLTAPVTPVRDADGRIDIAGTMQAITDVVESWVREHPEQWLWVHKRWRPYKGDPKLKFRRKAAARLRSP